MIKAFMFKASGALAGGTLGGIFAVSIDPTLYAAALITVIAALTTSIVTIINAVVGAKGRAALNQKADAAANHALEAATAATLVATKAEATDQKIEAIKTSSAGAERNSNGVLAALRADLIKSQEHNRALVLTVTTLTDLLKAQPRTSRASDVQKVEVVNDPLVVESKEL